MGIVIATFLITSCEIGLSQYGGRDLDCTPVFFMAKRGSCRSYWICESSNSLVAMEDMGENINRKTSWKVAVGRVNYQVSSPNKSIGGKDPKCFWVSLGVSVFSCIGLSRFCYNSEPVSAIKSSTPHLISLRLYLSSNYPLKNQTYLVKFYFI